jgi:DNA-binding transcriptional MerR regulator
MFTIDFAADFSGIPESQIASLEKKGILNPEKHGRSKHYRYGDIYTLRLVGLFRKAGIKLCHIEAAYEYLSELKPDQTLTSFILLHDGKEVFAVVDGNTLSASRFGQRIFDGTIQMLAVGMELEQLRLNMNAYVIDLKDSAEKLKKQKLKRFSSADLSKLLA